MVLEALAAAADHASETLVAWAEERRAEQAAACELSVLAMAYEAAEVAEEQESFVDA